MTEAEKTYEKNGHLSQLASGLLKYCKQTLGVSPKHEELRLILKCLSKYWLSEIQRGADTIKLPGLGHLQITPTRVIEVPDIKNPTRRVKVGGNKAKIKIVPSVQLKNSANLAMKIAAGQVPEEDAAKDPMPDKKRVLPEVIRETPKPEQKPEPGQVPISIFEELGIPSTGVIIEEV